MVGIGRDTSPVPWRARLAPALLTATCSLKFRVEVAEGDRSDTLHKVLQSPARPSLWSLSLLWLNYPYRHSCRLLLSPPT